MCSRFHDLALVHDKDLVAVFDRAEAMRDKDRGHVFCIFVDCGIEGALRNGIEVACGLIQDQNVRLFEHCPCDGKALSLASGEVGTVFLEEGTVAKRHLVYKIVGLCHLGCCDDVIHRHVVHAESQVVVDATAEQKGFLRNVGDAVAD